MDTIKPMVSKMGLKTVDINTYAIEPSAIVSSREGTRIRLQTSNVAKNAAIPLNIIEIVYQRTTTEQRRLIRTYNPL